MPTNNYVRFLSCVPPMMSACPLYCVVIPLCCVHAVACCADSGFKCTFCGTSVAMSQQQRIQQAQQRQQQQQQADAGSSSSGPPGDAAAADATAKAVAFKDRLVEYDRHAQKRTTVIDDQSDFFEIETNAWLTEEVRSPLFCAAWECSAYCVLHRTMQSCGVLHS